MSEEVRKWLTDIAGAIDNIDIHLNGKRDFTKQCWGNSDFDGLQKLTGIS